MKENESTENENTPSQSRLSAGLDISREVLLMKIGSLIIDKDHINKRMEADLATVGKLQCDYSTWYEEVQAEIDEGFAILKADV